MIPQKHKVKMEAIRSKHSCVFPGCDARATHSRFCPRHREWQYTREGQAKLATAGIHVTEWLIEKKAVEAAHRGKQKLYLVPNMREITESEARLLFGMGKRNLGRLIRGREVMTFEVFAVDCKNGRMK